MLTEERYNVILDLLAKKGSVTVPEIRDALNISESTVRRDLNALDAAGRLCKVFGGAVSIDMDYARTEPSVAQKQEVNMEEKRRIAKYAVSLLEPNDFIYLDAGTTTGCMIEYMTDTSVTVVTNAVLHANKLAAAGFQVLVIGGILKGNTEAVVGEQAILSIQAMHFTKGFFGTNGITRAGGFSTPDSNEALVKKTAMEQSRDRYVLADYSKFGKVSLMTFSQLENAQILTDRTPARELPKSVKVTVVE